MKKKRKKKRKKYRNEWITLNPWESYHRDMRTKIGRKMPENYIVFDVFLTRLHG